MLTLSLLALLKGLWDDTSKWQKVPEKGEKSPHNSYHDHSSVSEAAAPHLPVLTWPTFLINTKEAPGERSENLASNRLPKRRQNDSLSPDPAMICYSVSRAPHGLRHQKCQAKANKYGGSGRKVGE